MTHKSHTFPVMPTEQICILTLENTLSALQTVHHLDKEVWEPQENSAVKQNIQVETTMFCNSRMAEVGG